jgi:hypothetical protein
MTILAGICRQCFQDQNQIKSARSSVFHFIYMAAWLCTQCTMVTWHHFAWLCHHPYFKPWLKDDLKIS